MTSEELKTIFNNKKKRVERKESKRGVVSEKVVEGFEHTTFQMFVRWFNVDIFNQGCVYCGTTNDQTLQLYTKQRAGLRMDGTRGGKRGKRLEIDRKNPNLPYDDLDNLVWCCYWCNNAKSNFFSEQEFSPIGRSIGEALRSILQSIKP
jgi:hypothetical protein